MLYIFQRHGGDRDLRLRDFLHWIANDLEALGKTGILYALDIRKSFYEEIGFTLIESEFVWERLHAAEPDGGKGIL